MIITCKECNSSFNVDDGLIKETGSKVRCSKCENIFVAYPHSLEDKSLLDSDEQLLDSSGSSALNDLDSTLEDFFSDEESLETPTSQTDADDDLGIGLGLDTQSEDQEETPAMAVGPEDSERTSVDVEDSLDEEPVSAAEDMLEVSADGTDLDLKIDGGANIESSEMQVRDEELQDLSDLSTLDDDPLNEIDTDAAPENLDSDLDGEINQETSDEESGFDAELGLTGTDLEKETKKELEAPITEDSADLDPNLLLDQEKNTPEFDGINDANLAVEESEELDLADLDFESDDATTAEAPSVEDSQDLDFDLLLDQGSENQDVDEINDADKIAEETDELDLTDLDFESDDATTAEIPSMEDSEELDLDFGSEPENMESDSNTFGDELDLSDLEEIIDSEPDEVAENSPEVRELDLEQEDDQGVLTADAPASIEDEDELDFSDLDNMLETSGSIEDSSEREESDELDLQFDVDETVLDVIDSPVSSESAEEDDGLLDIEKMLEENEAAAENDLDSQLEMETASEDAPEREEDLELDFDLESELQEKEVIFDGSATADDELESNLLDSDEAEIDGDEFEEEREFQGAVTTDEFVTDELLETSDTYDQTDADTETDEAPTAPAAMMPKSRSKKPVLVALLLLFLTGGIFVIPNMLGIHIPYVSDIKIPYLSDLDIKIPYLSDKLNPKKKDVAGKIKIIPLAETISARFVNDSRGNQRFVIHGKIKNDYDHPRSFIKVTGKIYQKDGKIAKTETVYCGNMLSDSELKAMKIVAVNKRLHNRFGDRKSNLKVKTGKTIPFMIVFDQLPQNLDEYTVEVDGSSI